jgi:hypothetical protein
VGVSYEDADGEESATSTYAKALVHHAEVARSVVDGLASASLRFTSSGREAPHLVA